MLKIFAHRTHWCGIDEIQNTLEGMGMAIPANFNMEVDVRFKRIQIKQGISQEDIDKITPFISHDSVAKKDNPFPLETMFGRFSDEFINRKLTLAFHLKEGWDSVENIKEMKRILDLYGIYRFFFFGFKTKAQKSLWAKEFGWEQIADEIETHKNRGTDTQLKNALESKSKIVWIAEMNGVRLCNRDYRALKEKKKILYLVSPDCFSDDHNRFWDYFKLCIEDKPIYDGVCTDHPAFFNQFRKNA